jgi:predicted DNA-binding transcriptional regulator
MVAGTGEALYKLSPNELFHYLFITDLRIGLIQREITDDGWTGKALYKLSPNELFCYLFMTDLRIGLLR